MDAVLIQTLNALSLASILILVSLGLAIIFGMLGIVNLAHGEFFMLGAYCMATLAMLGIPVWWGLILAPVVVGAFGMAVERSIIRLLYKRPLDTLLATWGLSIIIRQVVRLTYGSGQMMSQSIITGSSTILGVQYPTYRLFIILATALVVAATFLFYFRSTFGLRIRLVITNRSMAAALGINVHRVDMWAFGVASALVGFAGAIMSPIVVINTEMGLEYLSRAFIVVIVGGISHLWGVLAGGGAIGGAEAALSFFTRPVVAQALVVMLALIVIRLRPQGIAGS